MLFNGKYLIFKGTDPAPGWWLLRPYDGRVVCLPTWQSAVRAMDLDAARQVARRNRVPLGPIRKSEGK